MLGFNTSLSALRASQVAIDTLAHNIANANTPGFHRQTIHLTETAPIFKQNLWLGTGVRVARINQIASAAVESALTTTIADQNQAGRSLEAFRQIEQQFRTGNGSIHQRFAEFFDEAKNLQAQPSDSTQRLLFVRSARSLASEITSISSHLRDLRRTARTQVEQAVDLVNAQLTALTDLNRQIRQAQAAGQQPNDLLDQHQRLVNEIAQNVDIQVVPQPRGFAYQFAGNRMSVENASFQINVDFAEGNVAFFANQSEFTLEFEGGRLGALQHIYNQAVPEYQAQLETLTTSLVQGIDHLHSIGLGLTGEFSALNGHRAVSSLSMPLNKNDSPFGVESGELFISVTDHSTGQRQLHRLVVDPEIQSLQDLAAEIDAINNVQAIVNTQDQTLSIVAAPGFGFDFAGRVPTEPDRSQISGDAQIQFSGLYSGPNNDRFDFTVAGSGTVGVASDLSLIVTDSAGQQVGVFNLGEGYEPGEPIEIGEGIVVRIESGALNDGDSFSADLVANADTSGILVALGLNTLFEGSSASNIRVSAAVENDPQRLAISRSGDSGDAGIAQRMHQLRDLPATTGQLSLQQFLNSVTAQSAVEVAELSALSADLQIQYQQLLSEREAISGVDPNEEMVRMLQFQRSFQASVRVITTIDETLVELMNIVR